MKKLGTLLLTLLMVIGLFPTTTVAAASTSFDQDMTAYLEEVSTTRGFEVTRDDIDQSLAAYYMETADFTTVDEISEFLGEVINADLSNLNDIYDTYELDEASLTQLLGEYGEELNDYIFLGDLEWAVSFYTDSDYSDSTDLGIDPEAYLSMLGELGLSDDELTNLKDHYYTIADSMGSDEVTAQMEDINNRLVALQATLLENVSTDSEYKPSDAEIAEISSIYEELFGIFQIKIEYSVSLDGKVTAMTLEELLKLEDIGAADLNVLIYDSNNNLLADAVVTNEFVTGLVGDLVDLTDDTTDDGDDAAQTVKGGELPKTASNYLSNTLLGMIVMFAGILVYRKVRIGKGEIIK